MSRPKISEKNKYYISKERYYELLHFCKQYTYWRKAINSMSFYQKRCLTMSAKTKSNNSVVETSVINLDKYEYYIHLICQARHQAIMDFDWDSDIDAATCEDALQSNVIDGISYDILTLYKPLPVSRDKFYRIRRAFFWHLDEIRN